MLSRRRFLKGSSLAVAGVLLPGCDDIGLGGQASLRTLHELLSDNQKHDRQFVFDARTNHTPMVLISLYRMGADGDRLRAYYKTVDRSSQRKFEGGTTIDDANWDKYLGRFSLFPGYLQYFTKHAKTHGIKKTLAHHMPRLIAGSPGAAFHGLLRLGFGLDLKDRQETLFGLSYLASTHFRAPKAVLGKDPVSFAQLLSELEKEAALRHNGEEYGIQGRLARRFSSREFRSRLKPLSMAERDPLAGLAETILEAFVRVHDFTVLHAVTSCHAMRLVLPYAGDAKKALTEYAYAIAAAYLSVLDLPGNEKPVPLPKNPGGAAALAREAIESDNDHVIKLTYTCLEEHKKYKDDRYLALAAREQGSPVKYK